MTERNEKWEGWLFKSYEWTLKGAGIPTWQQQIVDEITHSDAPRLIVSKSREHAAPRMTLKDLIERESTRIAQDMDRTFWDDCATTTSTPITADDLQDAMNLVIYGMPQKSPRQQYADAMDDYLDNGVPEPERIYDPKTQPWWEMPVSEVE